MMLEIFLKEIGLSDYETKIYLALLELGESTTGEILKKADLTSGKIYEILASLQKKGLVSMVVKNNIKQFSPADPERVLDHLEEKKQNIQKQEKNLQILLPEINEKIKKAKSPVKIEVFTGMKGLKTAYKKEFKYYNKDNTLYVMGVRSPEDYQKEIYNFFGYTIYPQRIKTKVKMKKLFSLDNKEKSRKKLFIEKQADVRYISYLSILNINIIGNLSILGIFNIEPVVITIENQEVAEGFIKQFNLLWKIAKK